MLSAQDRWITFNVWEDRAHGLDIGTALNFVAGGGKTIAARITAHITIAGVAVCRWR